MAVDKLTRRQLLAGTSVVAVGAFLTACGGGTPTASTAPSAQPSTAASTAPAASAPAASVAASTAPTSAAPSASAASSARPSSSAAASAAPSASASAAAASKPPKPTTPKPEELVLVWGTYQLQTTQLDPQLHVGTIAESQLRHIYEPLVQIDRDLTTVKPQLATEWKRLDDLTMQFKLRQNVKFHNGEDFDGDAVKFSILRPLNPANNAAARTTYAGISDVEVVDKYTVNIKTAKPDPALLLRLTGFSMTIVAPKWAAQGNDVLKTDAQGTGPYKLAPGGYTGYDKPIRLVANESYWAGAPKIPKVSMRIITELATRTAALRSGEVHIAKDVSVEEIAAINSSGRALAKITQSNRIPYYVMELRKPPLDNVKLRQAVNYGANIDAIIKAVLYGNGTRVATVVAPWHVGFDPDLKPYPYDPEKAKALMTEAGFPNGFDMEINYIQGRYMKDKEVAEAIAQELGKVGIKVKQNLYDAATFTQKDNAREMTGLVFASWGNWIFDADNMLYARWHSSLSKTSNSGKGTSGTPYQNPEYDKLVEDARVELDTAKRLALYKKAQEILYNDGAALFMYTLSDVYGVDNWVLWEPRKDEMVWAHEMAFNE